MMKNKITKKKLNKILLSHKLWLKDNRAGKQADLSGADLRGANLIWADLRGANLSGADLSGALLCDSKLFGADLGGAIFKEIE